jgi:HK97 family phage portal protein
VSALATMLEGVRSSFSGVLSTISSPSSELEEALSGSLGASYTGKHVTPENSLTVPTYYAGVRLIAETVRILPLEVFRPAAGYAEKATDSRLWALLHEQPNPEMGASELWELVTGWLCCRGNAFVFKERDAGGRVIRLWGVDPRRVMVGRYNGVKVYVIYPSPLLMPPVDVPEVCTDSEIIHFRAFGNTGLVGLSPVQLHRQALGIAMAEQEVTGRMMVNDGQPSGVLTTDQELSDVATKRLVERWRKAHEGLTNKRRVAVLEQGLKWQQTALSMADAQFLEQRRLSDIEIARILRVPASKLEASMSGSSLTYSNTEMEGIDFLTYSMMPWLDRIESPLRCDPDLQFEAGLEAIFDVSKLLRVQQLERYRAYWFAIASGWLNRAEVRQRENLPAAPPGEGLDGFRPVAMLKDPPLRMLEGDGESNGHRSAAEVRDVLVNLLGGAGNG